MLSARPSRELLWPCCAIVAAVLAAALATCAAAEDISVTAEELAAGHRAELDKLAGWCDEHGLEEQAEQTRAWAAPRAPNRLYVAVLPDDVGSDTPPEDASQAVLQWHERFVGLRQRQAEALFELARYAVRQGDASTGLDLVLAAVGENPDHEASRRLLGFREYRDRWCTPGQLENLRAGKVWHQKFGWLPAAHVPRYENGQRYYRGRWITADEDARLHRDIRRGWEAQTEHYTIRTNHSIEAAVRLGTRLEELYRVWKQLFVRYFTTEPQLAAMFDGRLRSAPASLPRHRVVYFRDREEYVASLGRLIPNIDVSIGIYIDNARCAYFFAGEEMDERTLVHEATHQLFHESRRVAPKVGRADNFWIVEGIAMYMETLRREDGYYVLGGFDDARMKAARYRLLHDDFYVPLAEFTGYGMEAIQRDKRIATLYSQAAGLTHFLIHYDGGRYRDHLVVYLETVYTGRADPGTLSTLTGVPYSELDAQYREFMQAK